MNSKYISPKMNQYRGSLLKASILLFASMSGLLFNSLQANPNIEGATIVNGTVDFVQPNINTLEITNSPNAIIDWNEFSIDVGKTTRFIQESATSQVLNRVTGSTLSNIQGQLNSNGRVYLINPNGIVFANGASVDTAGLVASTLNISNGDFVTARDRFSGTTGKITNQATLSMTGDGNIVLIAPEIENQGVLSTENGKLVLAAGQSVELASGNVLFEIQASESSALNLGELLTQRGEIGVFTDQLVQAGTIQATEAVQDANGNIILQAKSSLDLQANSTTQNMGGSISLQSKGTTNIAGQVNTGAVVGGSIAISGQQITIAGTVDASASTGNGGSISMGELSQSSDSSLSDTESITITGAVKADSLSNGNGNGGSISLLATNGVEVTGSLSTKGASAASNSGGNIDVFAQNINISGTVDASGNNGGNVFVGGDISTGLQSTSNVTITTNGAIKADAILNGNGGSIIAFANNALSVQGTLSAQGGSSAGNGGAIITTGTTELSLSAAPTLTAANGISGDWLLVAGKLIIDEAKASIISDALNQGVKVGLRAQGTSTKLSELALGKEITGDLEINSAINKTGSGDASLDLFGNTVAVNAPISSTTGLLNVGLLTENGELSDASTVNINAAIDTNGGVLTASDGVKALVVAAATVESEVVDDITDAATREVVTVAEDTNPSVDDTTTESTGETETSGSDESEGDGEAESKEDEKEEEESEQDSESSNESEEDTKKSSPPQQC